MANEFKIKKGLIVTGASGGTVVDIQGSQGQLFSVTDDLSGSIFAVSDISGVPIFDVNSSGLSTFDGSANFTGTIGIGTAPTTNAIEIDGADGSSYVYFKSSAATTGARVGLNGDDLIIENKQTSGDIIFDTAATERLRIASGGAATFAGNVITNGYLTLTGQATPQLFMQSNTSGTPNWTLIAGTNGTFTIGRAGVANDLYFNTSGSATFTSKAYGVAPITSDPDSTIATKGYVNSLITGATIYRGTWDPDVSLNSGYGNPDLSGVTQTSGYYYICSADGTATPNGATTEPNTWNTGDWVIWNDDIGTGEWQKIDNSSVLSGVGTGQTVALWQGASSVTDSETLGNAPITVSGNNATFAGRVTAPTETLTGSNSLLLTLNPTANNYGGILFQYGGSNKGFSIYNSGNMIYGGESGVGTILQVNGQNALNIDTSKNATFASNVYVGSATTNGGVINLIQSTTNPEIRIQSGESGATAFSIYNTATNPDAEQFFINNNLSSSHLGNARGALKLEDSSGTALTLSSGNATFAGRGIFSDNVQIVYTGSKTNDAGLYIQNDSDDWGIHVNKNTNNFGIRITSDGGSAFGIYSDAGANKINFTGTGNATFAGTVTATTFSGDLNGTINTATTGVTQTAGNNSTLIATTAYADAAAGAIPIGNYLPLSAGPSYPLTGDLHIAKDAPTLIFQRIGGSNVDPSGTIVFKENSSSEHFKINYDGANDRLEFQGLISTTMTDLVYINRNTTTPLNVLGGAYFTGNVGIGTTSPSEKLTVDAQSVDGVTTTIASFHSNEGESGDTAIQLAVRRSDSLGSDRKTFLNATGAGNFEIQRSGSTKVTISGTGNVGIGTTNPQSGGAAASWLSLNGTAAYSGGVVYTINSTTKAYSYFESDYLKQQAQTGFGQKFIVNGTSTAMTILSSGNVGIGTTSPDAMFDVADRVEIDTYAAQATGNNPFLSGYLRIIAGAKTGWGVDDELGKIEFYGEDTSGVGARTAASIIAVCENGNGTSTTTFSSGLAFYTSPYNAAQEERIRVTATGNVGIGTSTPNAKLDIQGTQGQLFSVTDDLSGSIFAVADISGVPIFDVNSSGVSYFDGNVGIGTASPTGKLDVVGSLVTARVLTTGSLSLIGTDATASAQTVLTISTGVGNATGPNIVLSKSRSQASGAVVASDPLGTIQFQGGNGTASVEGARIQSIAGSTWSSTNRDSDLLFWTTPNSSTTIAERMRITSTGNVGIGTTNPVDGNLQVTKTGMSTGITNVLMNASFADGSNGTGLTIGYRTDETTAVLAPRTATGNLAFYNYDGGWSESMRIKNNGNVGIGTTSPGATLDVNGATYVRNVIYGYAGAGNQYGGLSWNSTDDGFLFLKSANVTKVNINSNGNSYFNGGNVGIGTTSPLSLSTNTKSLTINSTRNDLTGALFFRANNSSKAQFYWDSSGLVSDTISGAARWYTGSTERMRITSAGNVGIGTTSPVQKLQVNGSVYSNGGEFFVNTNSGITAVGNLIFKGHNGTSYFEGMRLASTGNVGIGVTGPTTKLDVGGSVRIAAGSNLYFTSSNTTFKIQQDTTNSELDIYGGALVPAISIDNSSHLALPGYGLSGSGTPIKLLGLDSSSNVVTATSFNLILDDTPAASTTSGSGNIVNWSVSETVTAGTLYAVKTNGGWTIADADSEAKSTYMLAIALGSNATAGMLLQGFFYKSSHGFTIGAPLYVSNTAGSFSNSRPTGSGDYVRIIGYATSTNYIYFDPDKTWVKIA